MAERRYYERHIERTSEEELRQLQTRGVAEQVRKAAESDFYATRFKVDGFNPGAVSGLDSLSQVSVTTKQDICRDIDDHPPYGSRLVVPLSEITSIVETSGTSGKGKEVHVSTAADKQRIIRMEAFGFHWAGAKSGDRIAFTLPIQMTAAGIWWTMALDRMEVNNLRLGDFDSDRKLDYMLRYSADLMIATPAYVLRLEQAAHDRGMNLRQSLPEMRSILVAGEAKSGAWVAEREDVWGATFFEQWGCSAGAVAWSCENGMAPKGKPGLVHFLPHLAYMEVIDPESGEHVKDGEYGELVLTPLGIEGAPLIRFATGDRVRYLHWNNCSCGRQFSGIEAGSVSRYDDMVKIKGVNVWPSAVAAILEDFDDVVEHRATIYQAEDGREKVRIEVELTPEGTASASSSPLLKSISDELRSTTGINYEIAVWQGEGSLETEITMGHSGKVRRWRDLRSGGSEVEVAS